MLYGRQAEQAAIDELLQARSGALIVRGEAGIGKSALLDYTAATAQARVLRVNGVESETDLPFAALHLLLRPVLDHVRALPPQQAEALRSALGLGGPARGDRFLVGLATLSLLVELSAAGPLVCLVDDAQWLDGESADALLFAARRLHGEPVATLFAAREGDGLFPSRGLPELWLGELDAGTAHRLLAEQAADLPPAVREQLVAEARGNPLALVELARMLTAEQRRGALVPLSFSLGTAQPVTDRVLCGFRDRIAAMPRATRSCLLVAALDDRAELDVFARAIGLLGASLTDFAEVERTGLARVGSEGVVFRHPLVRTAVLLSCDIGARMAAHRALAEAVDGDRRAWHLAAVTLQPDEEVARMMECLALRARQRGGQTAVSAAYARAAELSADPVAAVQRWTVAAGAAAEAGLWERARELVSKASHLLEEAALPGSMMTKEAALPGSVLAELTQVKAKLEIEAGRPLEGVRLLHQGAEAVTDLPAKLSLLSLAGFYTWAGAPHPDQVALARRTEELCPDGDGLAATVRTLNHTLRLLLEGDTATTLTYQPPDRAERVPFEVRFVLAYQDVVRADHDGMLDGAAMLVEDCRAEGRLGRMPQAMTALTIAQLVSGRHRSARATVAAGLALAADVGQAQWSSYLAGLHAWLSAVAGAQEECGEMAEQAIRDAEHRRWMPGAFWAEYARLMLDLGAGRYEAVLERVDRAAVGPTRHAFLWRYAWPDYVEAATRAGNPRCAKEALRPYAEWARATGQARPLAVLHRAQALLAAEHEAERLFEQALVLHAEGGQPFDEARTRLVYGEWLRRQQRRVEARAQLEAAVEVFDRLDAAPWSARAAAELRATGASLPDRTRFGGPLAALTAQELQVVRLAVTGASNREIGAQLFLSPRTVASHLYKAFPKLGVSSRAELARLGVA
ncbi:AAA family ATPase [Planomonospora sp. ID67723]|uniref:ATP-binding protein n=1 Tax=Planomonospora sp. ID67723 TaxID=2738134 RepID=UPI0018C39947|nr:helix-turn-helix transcriptional regulator [Planomonospora sp. ID67723]MBG0831521.1 AAA family ATPase [Planomonospora sp. ID67723]